jgi:uncharacterized protein
VIRDYRPEDAEAVLLLNETSQPEVGPMDADRLALFERISPYFKVIEIEGEVVGMLIGLTESEAEYPSLNFGWFRRRLDRFAYVDRVALAPSARGRGWGPALYHDFETWARGHDRPGICAEVNTIPPNERSMRFHRIFGFVEIGRFRPYGPDTEVAMLRKPLEPPEVFG